MKRYTSATELTEYALGQIRKIIEENQSSPEETERRLDAIRAIMEPALTQALKSGGEIIPNNALRFALLISHNRLMDKEESGKLWNGNIMIPAGKYPSGTVRYQMLPLQSVADFLVGKPEIFNALDVLNALSEKSPSALTTGHKENSFPEFLIPMPVVVGTTIDSDKIVHPSAGEDAKIIAAGNLRRISFYNISTDRAMHRARERINPHKNMCWAMLSQVDVDNFVIPALETLGIPPLPAEGGEGGYVVNDVFSESLVYRENHIPPGMKEVCIVGDEMIQKLEKARTKPLQASRNRNGRARTPTESAEIRAAVNNLNQLPLFTIPTRDSKRTNIIGILGTEMAQMMICIRELPEEKIDNVAIPALRTLGIDRLIGRDNGGYVDIYLRNPNKGTIEQPPTIYPEVSTDRPIMNSALYREYATPPGKAEVYVLGIESFRKLAEAGVEFPGAELFRAREISR